MRNFFICSIGKTSMRFSESLSRAVRAAVLAVSCAAILPGQEMSLKEHFDKINERLTRLEDAQKTQTAKSGAEPAARDGGTGETEALRHQISVLAAEVEKLRSGEPAIEVSAEKASSMGLSPWAASVYRKTQGVSIAGYGEMLYQNYDGETQTGVPAAKGSQLDFLRAILYTGYRFNNRFVLNSEIEFEHASTSRGGEVSVEFAYLDYLMNKNFTVRGGLVLIPMGLTNEFHEPTAYLGARRSETETQIIPTTWRENGLGLLGSAGRISYRAYLVNGMDASRFSADGLRGGRQSGARAIANDMAFVGRFDFNPVPGAVVGGSIYTGSSGQGQYKEAGKTLGVRTTIGEIHAQMRARGFDLAALYARSSVADIAAVNRLRGLTGSNSLGELLQGGYVQLSYNLFSRRSESMRLSPYYRFEKLNTQASVPQGFASDPARDRSYHTGGIEFRPIANIAIKGDYQWIRNEALTGLNQFNINLGYSF